MMGILSKGKFNYLYLLVFTLITMYGISMILLLLYGAFMLSFKPISFSTRITHCLDAQKTGYLLINIALLPLIVSFLLMFLVATYESMSKIIILAPIIIFVSTLLSFLVWIALEHLVIKEKSCITNLRWVYALSGLLAGIVIHKHRNGNVILA